MARSVTRAIVLGFVLGCGGGGGSADQTPTTPIEPAGRPGLHIVSGGSGSDTVMKTLGAPIVVEVRGDSGQLMPGLTVNFGGLDKLPGSQFPNVLVGPVDGPADRTGYSTTSDIHGRASARVAFELAAGAARLRVHAPLYDYADTASFVILPGSPVKLKIVAGDTALNPDGVANIVVQTLDTWQNVRQDPYTLATTATDVLSVSGHQVRGLALGDGVVRIASGKFSDSVAVAVVPKARLVAFTPRNGTPDSVRVYTMNSDLSSRFYVRAASSQDGTDRAPAWSPAGDRILLQVGLFDPLLYVADTLGVLTRARSGAPVLESETYGEYSRDGQWIFFGGRVSQEGRAIWRMRADGTFAQRIGPTAGVNDIDSGPSPSPDGTKVVYWTNRTNREVPSLRVLDVATQTVSTLGSTGASPRWSPRGDLIAYMDAGHVKVMRPDGTQPREVGDPAGGYELDPSSPTNQPEWSPDGVWLIVHHPSGAHFINVDTGMRIRMPKSATGNLWGLSWRPG